MSLQQVDAAPTSNSTKRRFALQLSGSSCVPEELAGRMRKPGYARDGTARIAMASMVRRDFTWQPKRPAVRAHSRSEITCTNGRTYPLLAASREGYRNLCRLVTRMKLRRAKRAKARPLWRNSPNLERALSVSPRTPTSALLDIFRQHALAPNATPSQSRGRGAQPEG